MRPNSQAEREAVLTEARSWLRTPFHPDAALKGLGVDCGRLLSSVYGNAGIPVPVELGHFAHDWHLHATEERYLNFIKAYARAIEGPPQPADIVMLKLRNAKVYSHGAIVVEWPTVIHAYWGRGVETADATKGLLGVGLALFFSPWE